MQLRSGIRMMPQGLDRSQGLRRSAELDSHKEITAARIKAQVAHAAEIWHQDDATGPREVSGAQRLMLSAGSAEPLSP